MMQFSCADFTFPVLERLKALRQINLLGFDHVDIGLFARSTHFSPAALDASPRLYTAQAIADLKEAQLAASDVFLQIGREPEECAANDPSPLQRESNRNAFVRAVEFCAALGCRHLTGLPGVFHAGVERRQDLELAAREASGRKAACTAAGLEYAIEPHAGSICSDVASTEEFLALAPGVTLTLDYGHFVMAGESSTAVHALLRHASHVHVRGGSIGRLQTSVKENEIDFAGMMDGLQRLGYSGFLALEYVWIDWNGCNRTDNISETILLRRELEATIAGFARSRREPDAIAGDLCKGGMER
ncbi:MAG: sugar phosphate isomerase/epimerase family protein [Acidobacteriota bacterium]